MSTTSSFAHRAETPRPRVSGLRPLALMPTAPPSSPNTTPAPSLPPIASVKTNLSFSPPNLGQAINTPNQHSLDPHPLNSLAGLGTSYGTSPFLPRSELDLESEISTSAPASLASILASQVSINGYRNIDNIQQVSSSPLTSPRRSNLLLNQYLQSPSASPVPSSPPFPTPTPADPDQQPRSPRLNPNFNSGSFNPFQSPRSSQGHEDTLDSDPPNQVAPFSLSEPQTPRNSTGSSPVSCAGDWARCMQVSCPAGTGLHLIIEPQIPRCLTWTFTSSSSNSDSRDHFTINVSMPHQSESAVPDANYEEPAAIRATRKASKGQGAIAQAVCRSTMRVYGHILTLPTLFLHPLPFLFVVFPSFLLVFPGSLEGKAMPRRR